jgi:WhiB family redox-sensing transcriptional regulator
MQLVVVAEYEVLPPWMVKGKCRGMPPETFYPSDGPGGVITAKNICWGRDGQGECPVRAECLAYALEYDERFGVWGGTSERERRRLRAAWRKRSVL